MDTYTEYAKFAAERYEEAVRRVTQRMREMVDDFEKKALDLGSERMPISRTSAAGRAYHALTWGLANASIERIITDGSDADDAAYRAKEKSREEATGTDT